MKLSRRNAQLMMTMVLLTLALVACNAATSSKPAGSNPEESPVEPTKESPSDGGQASSETAVVEEISGDDNAEDDGDDSAEDQDDDSEGDDHEDDSGDDSAEDRDAASEGDDHEDDSGDDNAEDDGDDSAEDQDDDSEGDDHEDDSGDDNAEDDGDDSAEDQDDDSGDDKTETMEGEDDSESEESDDPENIDGGITEDGIMTEDNRSDRQRMISELWSTNFNRHTVPYDELLALLPVRDGIIPIDIPTFETIEEAAAWLADAEPVIALDVDGDARAYPLQILTWHEIVNDTVGEIPVIVTFCPLCNSALVFDRRLNGEVYDFGTSGWLRHSDLVMWDRNTESLWQQFTGEGIVGELAGEQLTFMPSSIISFANFKEAFTEGIVLSQNTGFGRPYGQNPYPGYDSIGQDPFAFIGVPDRRIAAMERVVTVSLEDVDAAYPLLDLVDAGVISDTLGEQDLVIFHVGGTASALDSPLIAMGDDVGATGVFDPNLNGQKLTFVKEGDLIVDEQSGSVWNIVGRAVDGPLSGEQLTPIVHGDHFWFSWAAFKPDTVIYEAN